MSRRRALAHGAVVVTAALLAGCSSSGGGITAVEAPTTTAGAGPTTAEAVAPTTTRGVGPTTTGGADCVGRGVVEHLTAPFGPAGHRGVEVYLPPCYPSAIGRRFPVVYLLHGGTADETQWPDVGITTAADELLAAGQAPPMIIVMPDGGPDMPDSLAKDLVDRLVPWTDRTFRTIAEPSGRAVGGISLGGRIALEAAADHPRLFAAVEGNSPAVASGHQDLAARLGHTTAPIRLDVGDTDSLRDGVGRFADTARAAGAAIQVVVGAGGHNRPYWRSQRLAYLQFYADALRTSPPPNPHLRGG
jgi:enterochelin esterase-like enzyme